MSFLSHAIPIEVRLNVSEKDRDAVDSAMERLDLKDLARGSYMNSLEVNGNESSAVVKDLGQESNVLLLDEPINGLISFPETLSLK